jgi:hypothetical protein
VIDADSDGISTGTLIGISVAVIAVLLCLGILAFRFVRRVGSTGSGDSLAVTQYLNDVRLT